MARIKSSLNSLMTSIIIRFLGTGLSLGSCFFTDLQKFSPHELLISNVAKFTVNFTQKQEINFYFGPKLFWPLSLLLSLTLSGITSLFLFQILFIPVIYNIWLSDKEEPKWPSIPDVLSGFLLNLSSCWCFSICDGRMGVRGWVFGQSSDSFYK